MRNLLIGMLVIAALGYGVVRMAFPSYDKTATKRVSEMLKNMNEGGTSTSGPAEAAACLWAAGAYRITDNARLSWASDNFDKWRRAKNLYRKTGDFTVDSAELVKDAPEDTAIVSFTLEGKPYKVRVPKDHAIAWEE